MTRPSQPVSEHLGNRPRPTEVRYRKSEQVLHVVFDTGEDFSFSAEYLRVESPSAEVQGHGPEQKIIVPGKRYVGINDIEQVGNYAIRIVFSDGHDTGLYSWRYLHDLGSQYIERWNSYLDSIESQGLSRDLG